MLDDPITVSQIGTLWTTAKRIQPEGWQIHLEQIHGKETGTFYVADSTPSVSLGVDGKGISIMGDSEVEALTKLIAGLRELTK